MLHNSKLHKETLIALDDIPVYTYIIDIMYQEWEQNM